MFTVNLLNALPQMPGWATWGIGIALSVSVLYQGLPRVMLPDPPHTLGYDVGGLSLQVRHLHSSWTLRPTAPGFTEVTLASAVEIGSNPMQRLGEQIFVRISIKQLDLLLAGLANEVEGAHV